MSTLKVNSIVNRTDNGGTTFIKGAKTSSGQIFTIAGGVNITGIVTAASFDGDGSELSNMAAVTAAKAYAYRLLLGDPPFRA